ncbi:MAG: hypothetical protein ACYTFG_14965 [Planctomycetota bacterium]|jgi:hypothetical protein
MRFLHWGSALFLVVGVFTGSVRAGEAEKEGKVAAVFEASRVTLDLRSTNVRAVLAQVEKQTGNEVAVGKGLKDPDLRTFEAEGETFWEVMDRLGTLSGNVYGLEAFRDGG